MAESRERTSYEKETLIFDSPEKAQEFVERVESQAARRESEGIRQKREVLAEETAGEFVKYGEAVGALGQPWEHSQEEHDEVQELVDVAFRDDLAAALKRAARSRHYPRVVDLMHDVLTGQLYEIVVQRGINRQRIGRWIIVSLVMVVVFMLVALLLPVIW